MPHLPLPSFIMHLPPDVSRRLGKRHRVVSKRLRSSSTGTPMWAAIRLSSSGSMKMPPGAPRQHLPQPVHSKRSPPPHHGAASLSGLASNSALGLLLADGEQEVDLRTAREAAYVREGGSRSQRDALRGTVGDAALYAGAARD